jgi:hypothetical protein
MLLLPQLELVRFQWLYCADVLARESSRYNLHNSSPRLSVKCPYVIPNRERRENPVILSGAQYACGIGFPFDCTNGSPAKQLAAEYSSTSACEKSQLIHFPTFRRPRSIAKNALSAMTTRRPARIAVLIFPLFINVLTHCRLTFSLAAASFTIMYIYNPLLTKRQESHNTTNNLNIVVDTA